MLPAQTSRVVLMYLLLFVAMPTGATSDDTDQQQMGVAREMVRVLEAYAVYKMGQYDLAFERYKALAEAGSRQGMYNLANMYSTGQGVGQDSEKAFEWYLRAARDGDRLSMSEVARAYQEGVGVDADPEQAEFWRARAAEKR